MSIQRKVNKREQRRAWRVRKNVKGSLLPRISVFRSLHHIYAQIIDDQKQKTIASFSSSQLEKKKGDKKARAHAVGLELAQLALKQGITAAVFDRGSFLYHGRVKSLAEGLREGGIHM